MEGFDEMADISPSVYDFLMSRLKHRPVVCIAPTDNHFIRPDSVIYPDGLGMGVEVRSKKKENDMKRILSGTWEINK